MKTSSLFVASSSCIVIAIAACGSSQLPPRPHPDCPTVASQVVVAPPAPTNPTPYAMPELTCYVELPGKHVPTPGCIVTLPIDDATAERVSALPNHDRWELHVTKATDDSMKTLAKVPWVRSLVLERPTLAGLDGLASLHSLEALAIEEGSVNSLAAIGAMTSIHSLEVIDVETPTKTLSGVVPSSLEGVHVDGLKALEDVSALGGIASLKVIDLERLPALKDVSAIAKVEGLEDLHLVSMPIAEVPIADAWKTSLTVLHVEGTPNVSSFLFLAKVPNVHVLHLNDTAIASITPVLKLAALEALEIEKTKVTDVAPLSSLKGLRYLLVDATIPIAKRDALTKALPHLVIETRAVPVAEGVEQLGDGTCRVRCPPGDCLCDPDRGITVPCPPKTK